MWLEVISFIKFSSRSETQLYLSVTASAVILSVKIVMGKLDPWYNYMVLNCQICLAHTHTHKDRRSFVVAKLYNMESCASGCFVSDSCHFNSSSVVKTFGWSMWSNSSLGSVLLLTGGWSERAVAGKLRGRGRSETWQVEAACGNVEMVVFPFSLNKMPLVCY